MHRLVLSAAASAHLKDAHAWCRRRYPAEYQTFRRTFVTVWQELEESPLRWAIWRAPDIRRRLVTPYPYAVFYHVDAPQVIVEAVLHQRQDPTRRIPP
jgi:plasmid stabilization system protein ParE